MTSRSFAIAGFDADRHFSGTLPDKLHDLTRELCRIGGKYQRGGQYSLGRLFRIKCAINIPKYPDNIPGQHFNLSESGTVNIADIEIIHEGTFWHVWSPASDPPAFRDIRPSSPDFTTLCGTVEQLTVPHLFQLGEGGGDKCTKPDKAPEFLFHSLLLQSRAATLFCVRVLCLLTQDQSDVDEQTVQ